MTNPDHTALMLLVDRSGSMHDIRETAQHSINEFIAGQRNQPGRRTIRLAQFDHVYQLVHSSLPADECPGYELRPRASTALLDAMAHSIRDFGNELRAMPENERPATVIWATVTDGLENASVDHTWPEVHKMIRHQEQCYGWQVLYLGANQDAIATAAKLGIRPDRSLEYSASAAGTRSAYSVLDSYVATAAAGGAASFSAANRANALRDDEKDGK